MKKNTNNFRTALVKAANPLTNETNGGGAEAPAEAENMLKDEPSTGGFGEAAPGEEPKEEEPSAQGTEAQAADEPKGFDVAAAVAEAQPIKYTLNLEQTINRVKLLHRATQQRVNLLNRIADLEQFEIALQEDGDELDRNVFTGCQIVIADGHGNQFVTKNPALIKKTAEYVRATCLERLAEIEAEIVFPN